MPRGKKKSGRAAAGDGSIRKKIVKKNGKEYVYWEARYTNGFDPETGKHHIRQDPGRGHTEAPGGHGGDREGRFQGGMQTDRGRVDGYLEH